MTLRAEYTLHQSDLGDFLSEPIWEERNGSMLSVLSAFARLDMDPWQEAARLAAMPRDAAAAALAKVLALLPPADAEQADPGQADHVALAHRLVEVLPQHDTARPAAQQGQRLAKAGFGAMTLILLLALALALGFLQSIGQLF